MTERLPGDMSYDGPAADSEWMKEWAWPDIPEGVFEALGVALNKLWCEEIKKSAWANLNMPTKDDRLRFSVLLLDFIELSVDMAELVNQYIDFRWGDPPDTFNAAAEQLEAMAAQLRKIAAES